MLRPTADPGLPPGVSHADPAMRVVAGREATGGAYTVLDVRSEPASRTTAHRHEREDQALLVLEGELTVVVDGAATVLRAGGQAFLPRGVPHRTEAGPAGARFVCICVPGGYEALVDAVQDARLAPDDLAAILAAAGIHTVAARW
ncbi:MAG TPA: cupin domain-containing protein [Solirubrobacteraceae bacterium]|jgi:quercetin dioxygenase-like cupin family protein